MLRFRRPRAGQVRDRPRHAEQPLRAAAAGPLELGEGARSGARPRVSKLADVPCRARRRAAPLRAPVGRHGDRAGHPRSAARRVRLASGSDRLTSASRRRLRGIAIHEVDPVAQRTRDASLVSLGTVPGQAHGALGRARRSRTGTGCMAATSWNRAGKLVARPARAMATDPPPSAGAATRGRPGRTSGNSSRNNTP